MSKSELIVEGEPAHLIIEAIQTISENSHEEEDGMIHWEGTLSGDSGAALVHALGRVTAELHAADMRSYLTGSSRNARTEEQRRADALIVLVQRLAEALELDIPAAPLGRRGAPRSSVDIASPR